MQKKALVTGAAGFVGAVVARRLREDGHDVHLLVRPESDPWRLEGVDAERHTIDLNDGALGETLRAVRPDWVFHLAEHGAYSSQTDWRRMVDVNVTGTMHLVEALLELGFEAFVNAGSSSEYGFTDHAPREDEPAEPNGHYALTKLSQTLYCRLSARQHDVPITTLRLYSVYGPYEEPTRLVPTLIARGLDGELPPLVAPDIARDFVYTDDVADAFVAAASHTDVERGAIYNVGTGRQTTLREAVAIARETLGIEAAPQWDSMTSREWDTTTWVANAEKAERELGWKARVPFEEGFRRFTRFIRDASERYRR